MMVNVGKHVYYERDRFISIVLVSFVAFIVGIGVGVKLRGPERWRKRRKDENVHAYEALIGNTPVVELKSLSELCGATVLVKVESANPGGTSKDRVAMGIIKQAERNGKLGGVSGVHTVVEGTSGSTGIALASICRTRGYECVIVIPSDQAREKREVERARGYLASYQTSSDPTTIGG